MKVALPPVYQLPLGSGGHSEASPGLSLPQAEHTQLSAHLHGRGAAAVTPPLQQHEQPTPAALPANTARPPCSQPRPAPHLLLQGLQAVVGRRQAVSVRGQPGPGVRFDQRQRRLVLLPGDVQQELNAERYAPARPRRPRP